MSKPVREDIFAFHGRRNRKSFLLFHILYFGVLLAILSLGAIADMLITFSMAEGGSPHSLSSFFSLFYILIIIAAIVFPLIALVPSAQRCRDFGWTGWAVLLCLVPYVGLLFWLAIFFVPGVEGENRYGSDPT